MYSAGDCIHIETGKNEGGSPIAHLFVIIFDAVSDTDETLLFPICTITSGYHDRATEIEISEHPFIRKRSYVLYYKGEVMTKAGLDQKRRNNIARKIKISVNQNLFQRIKRGISRGDTPIGLIEYYEDRLYGRL